MYHVGCADKGRQMQDYETQGVESIYSRQIIVNSPTNVTWIIFKEGQEIHRSTSPSKFAAKKAANNYIARRQSR